MTFDGGYNCSVHHVPMLITQSGLQHVCVRYDCGEHVRAQGPRKEDDVVTQKEKDHRLSKIKDVAQKKEPAKELPPKKGDKSTEKPVPIKETKPKKEKDLNMLSVSDVAREMHLEPKTARAKLRSAADVGPFGVDRAPDGRWPNVKRDSKEHKALIAFLQPPSPVESDDDDEDDEE
jgi:hypothetical protein